MANPKNSAGVATYGDHEVITPENKLRGMVKAAKPGENDDPVARAELALAGLSSEFASWMDSECVRLDKARVVVAAEGFNKNTKEVLFHAAHDIKGDAATFGFPFAGVAAETGQAWSRRRAPLDCLRAPVTAGSAPMRCCRWPTKLPA